MVKCTPPASSSKISSMLVSGKGSVFMRWIGPRMFTQNLAFPSFFVIITTGKDYEDEARLMIPASNILLISFRTTSLWLRAILLARWHTGVFSRCEKEWQYGTSAAQRSYREHANTPDDSSSLGISSASAPNI